MQARILYRILISTGAWTLLVCILNCGTDRSDQPVETILARVGDKTISLNEFIRRAEYTIRPSYCRASHNIDKIIILNSLIAEKMLALEAGDVNPLSENEKFQRYIQGRKEQAMRQWLYHKEIHDKIELDPEEVDRIYRIAGRKYEIQYFNHTDPVTADSISRRLSVQKDSFEEVYRSLGGVEPVPARAVSFNEANDPRIHEAMFSNALAKGQILGPIKNTEDSYTFIKVVRWTDHRVVDEVAAQQRRQDVEDRLRELKALARFEKYAGGLLRGKRVDFRNETLNGLIRVYAPLHLQSGEVERDLMLNVTLDKELGGHLPLYANLVDYLEANKNEPLYLIDGKTYTVDDFRRQLEIHPLVYRKSHITAGDFAEQFRLAVVDMIRDTYITADAYKKGYDRINIVQRNADMWRDAMFFLYEKNEFLNDTNIAIEKSGDIEKYLNPYVDSLQAKYSDVIEVDVDVFRDIQLSRIDMMAMQLNVPFKIIVPSFPQITTDNRLDYGRVLASK